MGLLAVNDLASTSPPNLSPSWTGTPVVSFVAGVGGTKNLSDHTFDPESDSLTYTLNGSSTAFPANVSMDSAGVITATNSVVVGTTNGILVDIDDGINVLVTSPSFSIIIANTITAQALRDLGFLLIDDFDGHVGALQNGCFDFGEGRVSNSVPGEDQIVALKAGGLCRALIFDPGDPAKRYESQQVLGGPIVLRGGQQIHHDLFPAHL